MRKPLIAWVAALAAVLCAWPAGAGQHFGLAPGDVAEWASVQASMIASTALGGHAAGGPSAGSVSGFFYAGASVGIDPSSSTGPSIVTMAGCVAVQSPTGASDAGCFQSSDTPVLFDPTLSHVHVQFTAPSSMYPGTSISVDGVFESSMLGFVPIVDPPSQPANLPDFDFSVGAGLGKNASVTGTVSSKAVGTVSMDGSLGSLRHGATITACSLRGATCF